MVHRIVRPVLACAALASFAMFATAGSASAQQGPVKIGVVFSFSGGDDVEQGKEFNAAIAAYQKSTAIARVAARCSSSCATIPASRPKSRAASRRN